MKINDWMIEAIKRVRIGEVLTRGNTAVSRETGFEGDGDIILVKLYNSYIVGIERGTCRLCASGFLTTTTFRRINAVADFLQVPRFYVRRGRHRTTDANGNTLYVYQHTTVTHYPDTSCIPAFRNAIFREDNA